MRTIKTFAQLMTLVSETTGTLYVRYSRGPQVDARSNYTSRNHAAGRAEAGLSVERLTPPSDWPGSAEEYVIMQVASYCYLLGQGDRGTRGWIMTATEVARGSDNEALVTDVTPVAWLDTDLVNALSQYHVAAEDAWQTWRRLPLVEKRAAWDAGRGIEHITADIRKRMLGF